MRESASDKWKLGRKSRKATKRLTLWADHRRAMEDRHSKVLAEFDRKIAAMETVEKGQAGMAAPFTPPQPSPEEGAKTAAAEAANAAAAEAGKAVGLAYEQLHLTVPAEQIKAKLISLKDTAEPTEDYKKVLATMHHWCQASTLGDTAVPFTFKEMGSSARVAYDLVGKPVWDDFFGSEEGKTLYRDAEQEQFVIKSHHVCPMQLRQLMFRQLIHYAAALESAHFRLLEFPSAVVCATSAASTTVAAQLGVTSPQDTMPCGMQFTSLPAEGVWRQSWSAPACCPTQVSSSICVAPRIYSSKVRSTARSASAGRSRLIAWR